MEYPNIPTRFYAHWMKYGMAWNMGEMNGIAFGRVGIQWNFMLIIGDSWVFFAMNNGDFSFLGGIFLGRFMGKFYDILGFEGDSWNIMTLQGLVNVPIEHHPTIGDIISNRYLKVMWNKSPTNGTSIPTPALRYPKTAPKNDVILANRSWPTWRVHVYAKHKESQTQWAYSWRNSKFIYLSERRDWPGLVNIQKTRENHHFEVGFCPLF